MRRTVFIENLFKNIVIFVLLVASYGPLTTQIQSFRTDSIGYQTIIVLSSLLIMAFLFCTYTFTYKESDLASAKRRLLDYLITGITMYGCGALLEISYVATNVLLQSTFTSMGILMVLFYISLVLFDFWDLTRNKLQQ